MRSLFLGILLVVELLAYKKHLSIKMNSHNKLRLKMLSKDDPAPQPATPAVVTAVPLVAGINEVMVTEPAACSSKVGFAA